MGRTRAIDLAYVDLKDHGRPHRNNLYDVISACDDQVGQQSFPDETELKRLNIDLYSLYIDDLPDFTHKNEGLLKISVNTRDPQNINNTPTDASVAIYFYVKDGHYAPSFLYKALYRNILFRDWINLRIDLFELDKGADVYYHKIKSTLENVPEIKNLDVLRGIPYLNIATSLFEGIIKTFGKNPDDNIWSEMPTLEIHPTPMGAFLRSGIYVIFEKENSHQQSIDIPDLKFVDNKLVSNKKHVPNHLIFGLSLRNHHTNQ